MQVKVITNHKSQEYFMARKKLTKCQIHQAKFLSGFNFNIFYIPDKENQKPDLPTYCPNNLLSDDNNNCKQYLLQTIFYSKRQEIILIQ